jgi:drug/metabolite transporter (DMT)-like permease
MKPFIDNPRNLGVISALTAALLFGVRTPLAKILLGSVNPWMLAGLMYLGSGVGLMGYRLILRPPAVQLSGREWLWLGAAMILGGVLGPLLLMVGLTRMGAASASILLNAESVMASLLAWVVFREHVNRRLTLGALIITARALILS